MPPNVKDSSTVSGGAGGEGDDDAPPPAGRGQTKKRVTPSKLLYENDDLEILPRYVKMGYRTTPILFVNGSRVPDDVALKARPNQTLLNYLRTELHLTGSKLGCAEGGCGACTVMLSKIDPTTKSIRHYTVNACLMPILAADGCHITTVEGVGTVRASSSQCGTGGGLHPVQQAMVDMHGSQCGFCTPGIIVTLYSLLSTKPHVADVHEHLDGNLCRCTGYRSIWDAARSLCDDGIEQVVKGPCGIPCQECPEREVCQQDCNLEDVIRTTSNDKMMEYANTFLADTSWRHQPDHMFPEALKEGNSDADQPLVVVDQTDFHAGGTWFKPTTFVQLLSLLKDFEGKYKLVVGNTEVGIETKFKHAIYPRLVYPSESIVELFGVQVSTSSSILHIGSCCPLSTLQHYCKEVATKEPHWSRTLLPIHDMLRWFASTQIRNVACLGGNLVTASPISDMNPVLAAMNATLVLSSLATPSASTSTEVEAAAKDESASISRRRVPVSDFFLRYRTVDLRPGEVVECVEVPVMKPILEYFRPFKQARRREDDISIVTSGMFLRLKVIDDNNTKYVVDEARLAFGGMAPTTIMAPKTSQALVGAEFCQSTFLKAIDVLMEEMKLPESVPGGQAAFRMTLAASFLYKFFLSVVEDLKCDVEAVAKDPNLYKLSSSLPPPPAVDPLEESGTYNFVTAPKPDFWGEQVYPKPKVARGYEEVVLPNKVSKTEANSTAVEVGQPATHASGPLHCTGEAQYADDIPLPPRSLEAVLVVTTQCGCTFESMDVTPALQVPGVFAVYAYEDIVKLGGKNEFGPTIEDEVVFLPPGSKVVSVGQVLGVVVAETLESAELASRSCQVTYGPVTDKVIMSIEEAIAAKSFYEMGIHELKRGDESVLASLATMEDTTGVPKVGDVVKVSGSFRCGNQEHFYLETQSTVVVPSDADTNLTIYCSTQAATKTQKFSASATGTPASKVVVRVKRLGGGFGGKETRTLFSSLAAAVAAKISCRPVRLTLGRDEDMKLTGNRHAFLSHYKASARITEEGAKLEAMEVTMYSNAGFALDLSIPVMDRALFHVDGCYFIPHMRATGIPCRTAQAPHTAFRGFGGPQGMVVVEHVMDHLALACGVSQDALRACNFYKKGELTPFGMYIGESTWNVPTMWDRLYKNLDIPKRRAEIEEFNSKQKWIKRGLSFIPTKFGIAYTAKFMNQGGALVHLYTDGTVLVSHGGVEMGQGLHTKVCQVAAQAFGIPLSYVYVNDSSTDKVANTIPTAASMSTDTYGMATLDACRQILKRLEPIREQLGPDASLKEIANAAHMARIDLSAHGFYAVPGDRVGFDWTKPKPVDCPEGTPENSWRGHPFNYFTQGVACTEVEIDVLSGSHRTLRSDVIVDVGSSINPAIDIGQIEGAFIQGMGWSTTEEVIYADDDHTWVRPRGALFTAGPGTYKIPAFNCVPETFNVALLENVPNPFAVHSSKAIGEPPLFLGTTVFYAIKDAISAARKQNLGDSGYFEMRMPATSERIRMYSADPLATKAASIVKGSEDVIAAFQPQGTC